MIGSMYPEPPPSSVYGPEPLDKFRISEEPRTAVAGNVELRHHADAAIVRVGDEFANLVLRIKHSVGTRARQLGKHFALDAKSLVVGEMPVQHVHFTAAMPSILRLSTSMGMKWRLTSMIVPRQGKRG